MFIRLGLIVCCIALLIVSGCHSSETKVSLNDALSLATKELFHEEATAVEPIKMSLEIVETRILGIFFSNGSRVRLECTRGS